MAKNLAALRQNYTKKELSEAHVNPDPMAQFELWFEEASECELNEPNVMSLATADKDGKPSCRIVLLKSVDDRGFVFFTNYNSHKGNNLEVNPFAALTFFWAELERQVRIEGPVVKLSGEESDEYFNSRPEGSKIGAWVSPQSKPIAKKELVEKEKELEQKFKDSTIPRPAHWGGYLVRPERIEFWQGRPNRLHDRILYQKTGENWIINRLAP